MNMVIFTLFFPPLLAIENLQKHFFCKNLNFTSWQIFTRKKMLDLVIEYVIELGPKLHPKYFFSLGTMNL